MTVYEAIRKASSEIDRRDAETLLFSVLGRNLAWLRAYPEASLEPDAISAFFDKVSRRAQHWPLQYLTGRQEFFSLELEVSPDVLIPRPETERLVEAVLTWAANAVPATDGETGLQIVDIGTGSGAVALALARHLPGATVLALDLSVQVRPVVERNALRLGLADRVRFLESDLLGVLRNELAMGYRFDVVVSNPPYVPFADASTLEPQVRDFEPHLALFGGEDGLGVYRRLIPEAREALRPGGLLAMEFGFGQKDALEGLLAGWAGVQFHEDYAGIPRVVLAERV